MSTSLFSLEGRVALVTGGNSGLGRAMALGLRDAGATVVITGRNPEKNQAMLEALGSADQVLELDVRDEAAVEQVIADVVSRFGRLDILVNNAGGYRGGTLLKLSLEDWNTIVETNLTGSFLCAKAAAKAMIEQGQGGKIINIGSMYSIFGGVGGLNYAASKTGVLGLTRGLAAELTHQNIQVNAILPGWHWTPLTEPIRGTEMELFIRNHTPAKRWGTAEDLVGATIFLASAASDFVTGSSIVVDGGFSITKQFLPGETPQAT